MIAIKRVYDPVGSADGLEFNRRGCTERNGDADLQFR